jgi:hypothetical protein
LTSIGEDSPGCGGEPRCYSWGMITGVQVSETMQLIFVLIVLFFTIGGIYLMQRYTGV